MKIRQEESSPIGDYFHDSGVSKAFQNLTENVDEFEVETQYLISNCDYIIDSLKGLKETIKKVEKEWNKYQSQKEIADKVKRGNYEI